MSRLCWTYVPRTPSRTRTSSLYTGLAAVHKLLKLMLQVRGRLPHWSAAGCDYAALSCPEGGGLLLRQATVAWRWAALWMLDAQRRGGGWWRGARGRPQHLSGPRLRHRLFAERMRVVYIPWPCSLRWPASEPGSPPWWPALVAFAGCWMDSLLHCAFAVVTHTMTHQEQPPALAAQGFATQSRTRLVTHCGGCPWHENVQQRRSGLHRAPARLALSLSSNLRPRSS